jgi:hypothetical protein
MFAKLFSSITESSLWSEPKEVRLLFVTMLAKADQNGFVEASIPGLARVANLTIEETQAGLECLSSPDVYSKNPDNEGRRVLAVPGGFMLLNYEEYRARRSPEERREYMREYMKDYRKRGKADVNSGKQSLTPVSHGKPGLAQAEAEAEADITHTHTHKTSSRGTQPTVPEDLAVCWSRWIEYHFAKHGSAVPAIQAEAILMDLGRRGPEKAARDIEFSIRKDAKSILDSDNDFEKRSPSAGYTTKQPRKRNYE